ITTVNNTGLVHGNGRINGKVDNLSVVGEVRADALDRIVFTGTTGFGNSTNSGQINLFGGAVEFTGSLTNNAGGRITGRGTFITHNGLIMNGGTFALSGGTSDVLGPITNNSGGKIIVTGGSTSTFYDA